MMLLVLGELLMRIDLCSQLELEQHNFEFLIRKKGSFVSSAVWPYGYDAISTTSTTVCTCFFRTSSTLTYPCKTKVLSSST
ncbi:hypothetical protein L1987_33831 [Smallanthus sonchifolius]|uniref:Uncharacterized protein n=1 Tax=Smallanthus sonchifolius TaxID=185202 RepID=A0ACB9HRY2_9ASTR|nr:hypothetical protein L1987_33831 [Smallanthus sonchifolius]